MPTIVVFTARYSVNDSQIHGTFVVALNSPRGIAHINRDGHYLRPTAKALLALSEDFLNLASLISFIACSFHGASFRRV